MPLGPVKKYSNKAVMLFLEKQCGKQLYNKELGNMASLDCLVGVGELLTVAIGCGLFLVCSGIQLTSEP